jgi:hypothetical protein
MERPHKAQLKLSMTESFLILLAAGIMLSAAVCDPNQVTLNWLRLAGILALAAGGLGFFFLFRGLWPGTRAILIATGMTGALLTQLATVQIALPNVGRTVAALAAAIGIYLGHDLLRSGATPQGPALLSALGIAAMSGLVLMEMLLGHAYLTASQMTMRPLRRLNLLLAATFVYRIGTSVALVLILQARHPIYMLWGYHGLYILTRWIVGLLIPAVFIYMTHDCIKRRATQSATGILYVAGILVFIGEIIATYLVRATGLPF